MQLDLFSELEESTPIDEMSEVTNRPKVYVGGTIGRYSQRESRLLLSEKGLEPAQSPSKFVCAFLLGEEVKDEHIDIIDKLAFNGFHIPVYRGVDAVRLLESPLSDWPELKLTDKNITIDSSHYDRFHVEMDKQSNPIYGREIFFGKGWKGHFPLLDQMTGFLGSCGDIDHIWPETDMIALSDSTVECLRLGLQDETTRYIANHYNQSDAITFSYKFISESDILFICQKWSDDFGSVEMERYLNIYNHTMQCGRFVALDFETVDGLVVNGCTYHHLPLSVGMVKVDRCEMVAHYHSLMRPPVSPDVRYRCYVDKNLNQDTLRDAPSYAQVSQEIVDFCSDADYLVSHNHTERHVLEELSELCGLKLCQLMLDTLQILKRHGETGNSLTEACVRHGISRTGCEHDALSDATACAALYVQLLKSGIVEEVSRILPAEKKRSHSRGGSGDISAYTKQIDESLLSHGSIFDGIAVVITGMEYAEREKLYKYMHQRGAIVKHDVSRRVDWLVVGPNGENSTRKLNRAKEFGVRIMQLDELLQLIEEDKRSATAAP